MQACRYQVPQSVETECLPYPSERLNRKRSATNIFRSFDILNPRISLFVGSIAIQSQMNSEPILFTVSSTMNSEQPSDSIQSINGCIFGRFYPKYESTLTSLL